jgi:hypothetical protein
MKYIIALVLVFFMVAKTMAGNFVEDRDLVIKAFDDYKKVQATFNLNLGNVRFVDKGSTHAASAEPDIFVQLNQVERYTKGKSEIFRRLFIEFMLAHEIAHKMQFSNYKKEVIEQTSGGEGKIFLECNADILAGLLMTDMVNTIELPDLINNQPGFSYKDYLEQSKKEMFAVYKQIFEMDRANSMIATHPTHLQRLIAAKEGVMLGVCTMIQFIDPSKSVFTPEQTEQYLSAYRTISKGLGLGADQTSGNNPFNWAHIEAIRITNENNDLAKRMTRYNTRYRKVYGDQPHYEFSFEIYNDNPVDVRFAGRIYSTVQQSHNRQEVIEKAPVDCMVFDKVIEANSSIRFSGQLDFIPEIGSISQLIMPGDRESLYFVFDRYNPTTDQKDRETKNIDFFDWTDETLDEIDDHIKDIVRKSDEFFKYVRGIAVSRDSTLEMVVKNGRRFEPLFKAALNEDEHFTYYEERQSLAYEFKACSLPDSNDVKSHFLEINDRIKTAYSGVYQQRPASVLYGNTVTQHYIDKDNSTKIRTMFTEDNYNRGNYCVIVKIYGSTN